MSFAWTHFVGGDDSNHKAMLDSVEGNTSRTMGRVASVVTQNTKGTREFGKAITQSAGLFTLAAAGSFALGLGISKVYTWQSDLNKKIREEQDLRAKTLEQAEALVRSARIRAGLEGATPNQDQFKGMAASLREQVEAARKVMLETQSAAEFEGQNGVFRWIGNYYNDTEKKAENAKRAFEELLGKQKELEALAKVFEELDRKAAFDSRMARQRQKIGIESDLRSRMFKNAGDEEAAARESENLRYLDQLEAIRKLEEAEKRRYDRLREQAEQAHQSELDRIKREQAERERVQALESKMAGESLEAELARAKGQEAEARRIEERIRLERDLEAIRTTKGIDDAERARREKMAREASGLRMAAIGAGNDPTRGSTINAGVTRNAGLIRQVFGDPSRTGVGGAEDTQRKQFVEVKSMRKNLDTIVRDGVRTTARFA